MRTKNFYALDPDHRRSGKKMPQNCWPCVLCGKPVKFEKGFQIHLINGGADILHPQDESLYKADAGDMGLHYVGSECVKKVGKEWTHPK